MLLEHLETKNEPIDRVQVIDTKYLNIYNSFALYVNYGKPRLSQI